MKTQIKITVILFILMFTLMIIGGVLYTNKSYSTNVEYETVVNQEILLKSNKKKTSKKSTKKKTVKKSTKKKKTTKKKKKYYSPLNVATASREEYYNYAKSIGGYDDTQMSCLINLWQRESGWNPRSRNRSSGACGIPQALPCSKIKAQQGSYNWQAQIRWGVNYIRWRKGYGSPCKA